MTHSADSDLVNLLGHDDSNVRMNALHWLCESYSRDPEMTKRVFNAWDHFGEAIAFPEFPMLSFFPVDAERIVEACQRAQKMVADKALTDTVTRSAGKLIEQVVRLTPQVLEPHVELLERTCRTSKIFFRVDLKGMQNRIEFSKLPADELANHLDGAIARLTAQPEDAPSVHRALHAIETLRREHPNYLDLRTVLDTTPGDEGPQAISFQLTMQSLAGNAQLGLEREIGQHLADEREPIYTTTVDALVQLGNLEAAQMLVEQFQKTTESNQQWIARGLQRIRVAGSEAALAAAIAQLRDQTPDPRVWLMLLIAEIRQLAPESSQRIAGDLPRIIGYSDALISSLLVYLSVHGDSPEFQMVHTSFVDYVQRASQKVQEQLDDQRHQSGESPKLSRDKARREALERYRRGK